jgi:uncharacterized membrane protein AbrB (regulator of aidB expression)
MTPEIVALIVFTVLGFPMGWLLGSALFRIVVYFFPEI